MARSGVVQTAMIVEFEWSGSWVATHMTGGSGSATPGVPDEPLCDPGDRDAGCGAERGDQDERDEELFHGHPFQAAVMSKTRHGGHTSAPNLPRMTSHPAVAAASRRSFAVPSCG